MRKMLSASDWDFVQIQLNYYDWEYGNQRALYEMLEEAAALLRSNVTMPCTGCRYCVPNCPMELDIPSLLIAYNDFKADGSWRLNNLRGLPQEKQPASCIACGACTAHCPQGLKIPEAMEEMEDVLQKEA